MQWKDRGEREVPEGPSPPVMHREAISESRVAGSIWSELVLSEYLLGWQHPSLAGTRTTGKPRSRVREGMR